MYVRRIIRCVPFVANKCQLPFERDSFQNTFGATKKPCRIKYPPDTRSYAVKCLYEKEVGVRNKNTKIGGELRAPCVSPVRDARTGILERYYRSG